MKVVYEMINGIPMWWHITDNGDDGYDAEITSGDNGKIAERIGTRLLSNGLKNRTLIKMFYPDIEVLSFKKLNGEGDYLIEISYRYPDGYGKKILLFEIKYGKVDISQSQIKKYSSMLLNPDQYFKKADEVKIVYMIFDKVDTVNQTVHYYFSVLKKDFAKLILDREPRNIFSILE